MTHAQRHTAQDRAQYCVIRPQSVPVHPSRPSGLDALFDALWHFPTLIRLHRPAGIALLLWPTLAALWLAERGQTGWFFPILLTFATILTRSAGCIANDLADQRFDRFVERTSTRPLTNGQVAIGFALTLALLLALLAFAIAWALGPVVTGLAVFGAALSVFYPFCKRFMPLPQAVLGIAFSLQIPIVYAAFAHDGFIEGVLLFIGNWFWVMVYDTYYAMADRRDDERLGLYSSAISFARWFGRNDLRALAVCAALYLSFWALAGWSAGLPWPYWLAMLLAAAQMSWHWRIASSRQSADCLRAFNLSHWTGMTLWLGMVGSLNLPQPPL